MDSWVISGDRGCWRPELGECEEESTEDKKVGAPEDLCSTGKQRNGYDWHQAGLIRLFFRWEIKMIGGLETHQEPWLVWLSGLSASLQTEGSSVQFPVRHMSGLWARIPSRGCSRGNYTLMFPSFSLPSPLSKNKIKSFFKKDTHQEDRAGSIYSDWGVRWEGT